MKTVYAGAEESKEAHERRIAASVLPYEAVGAPRVGTNPEADAWVLENRDPEIKLSDQELLREADGHYVLRLAANCDGIPNYSNGGMYDGIDETSFRGSFLTQCLDLLDKKTLDEAWTTVITPETAVAYGKRLLLAAEGDPKPVNSRTSWLKRLFGKADEQPSEFSLEEQRDILRAAGRWYIFWGERGHPIWAYW